MTDSVWITNEPGGGGLGAGIFRYQTTGSPDASVPFFTTGLMVNPSDLGLVLNGSTYEVWVVNDTSQILRFGLDDTYLGAITDAAFNFPTGIFQVPSTGVVWIAAASNTIVLYNANGTPTGTTLTPDPLFYPANMCIGPDGAVWVANIGNATYSIYRFNTDGTSYAGGTITISGLNYPYGLLPVGSNVWAVDFGDIYVIDAAGATVTTVPDPGGGDMETMALVGSEVWAPGFYNGPIYRFDSTTYAYLGSIPNSGFSEAYAICVVPYVAPYVAPTPRALPMAWYFTPVGLFTTYNWVWASYVDGTVAVLNQSDGSVFGAFTQSGWGGALVVADKVLCNGFVNLPTVPLAQLSRRDLWGDFIDTPWVDANGDSTNRGLALINGTKVWAGSQYQTGGPAVNQIFSFNLDGALNTTIAVADSAFIQDILQVGSLVWVPIIYAYPFLDPDYQPQIMVLNTDGSVNGSSPITNSDLGTLLTYPYTYPNYQSTPVGLCAVGAQIWVTVYTVENTTMGTGPIQYSASIARLDNTGASAAAPIVVLASAYPGINELYFGKPCVVGSEVWVPLTIATIVSGVTTVNQYIRRYLFDGSSAGADYTVTEGSYNQLETLTVLPPLRMELPDAPAQILQSNGATGVATSNSPMLSWYPLMPASATYHVQLGTDPTFAATTYDVTSANPYLNVPSGAGSPLASATTYYWRVMGLFGTGVQSPWSATRHFTTA